MLQGFFLFISMDSKTIAKVVAKAIFYASIQSSIGSVEMSSKFSVMNFSKDQKVLQRAADALRSYILIGTLWTIGTVLSLYASHGMFGVIAGLIANIVMMGWIVVSYRDSFKKAAEHNHLKMPTIFQEQDKIYIAAGAVALIIGIFVIRKSMKNEWSDLTHWLF